MGIFRQLPGRDHYNSGMIDLDAPILPGKSAAGVSVGGAVSELLAVRNAARCEKLPFCSFNDVRV